MFAIADSASMRWARVMRGIASMASTVTLRVARRWTSSLFWAGQMKPIRVAPGLMRSASWPPPGRCAGGRTLSTMSAAAHKAGASGAISAPAST